MQVGDAQVDSLHALFLIVGQQSTLAHKLLVSLLQEFLVLALKRVMLTVIHLSDAFEERHVERDFVFQLRQHRQHLLLNLAQFGSLVSFGQCKEHTTHTVEQASTLLVSNDGVLEGGRIRTIDDFGNLVAALLNGLLEGRQVVRGLNLTEIRCSVGQRAFL